MLIGKTILSLLISFQAFSICTNKAGNLTLEINMGPQLLDKEAGVWHSFAPNSNSSSAPYIVIRAESIGTNKYFTRGHFRRDGAGNWEIVAVGNDQGFKHVLLLEP